MLDVDGQLVQQQTSCLLFLPPNSKSTLILTTFSHEDRGEIS